MHGVTGLLISSDQETPSTWSGVRSSARLTPSRSTPTRAASTSLRVFDGSRPGFGLGSSARYVSSSALTTSISSVWRLNSSFPIHSSVMSSVTTGLFGSGDMRVEPAAARHRDSSALDPYRPWLMAAAIYNLVAGAAGVCLPTPCFSPLPPPPPPHLPPPPARRMFLLLFFTG